MVHTLEGNFQICWCHFVMGHTLEGNFQIC